jgi:hypothetical protein
LAPSLERESVELAPEGSEHGQPDRSAKIMRIAVVLIVLMAGTAALSMASVIQVW